MSVEDAESQAQSARRTQIDSDRGSDLSYSQSGLGQSRKRLGNFGWGDDRAAWERANINNPVIGGIVTQLIKQAEDQLGEAEACITWYEEQKAKIQQRLEDLKKLQDAADQSEKKE